MKHLVILALLLTSCGDGPNFRRDRKVWAVCDDGSRIYKWDDRYWVWDRFKWEETNKDVCK